MDLQALRNQVRTELADTVEPYLWSDPELDVALNDAQNEACIRARLIEDSSTEAVCNIDITTTAKRYPLNPLVIDVLCVESVATGNEVTGWTLTESEIVFSDYPAADDTIQMTVVRLPMEDMSDDTDEPEIRPQHHLRLLDWAKRCAYLKQDADTFDETKALRFEASFERSFGARPSANVQRKQREKTGRVVRHARGGF